MRAKNRVKNKAKKHGEKVKKNVLKNRTENNIKAVWKFGAKIGYKEAKNSKNPKEKKSGDVYDFIFRFSG